MPQTAIPLNDTLPPSETVSFGVWVGALTDLIDNASLPSVENDYREFLLRHRLPHSDTLARDFRRLRILFEAARDGGFWHLRWAITDQRPSSLRIWQQWRKNPVLNGFASVSATAECDESSALVGMLARHMRASSVGLFYPTWNHTIAVWAPLDGKTKAGLIQLPTTQIFLECSAGFDRTSFGTRLKNIERYPNRDLRATDTLPRARAEWLLRQVRSYAAASPALWDLMRAKRAFATSSTMGSCLDEREHWYREIVENPSTGNRLALEALAQQELDEAAPDISRTLEWLKS